MRLSRRQVPGAATGPGTAYLKFDHPASHYALTGVAAVVTLSAAATSRAVKVGVTGVGPKAYRATGVEEALVGQGRGRSCRAASRRRPTASTATTTSTRRPSTGRTWRSVFTRRALEAAIRRASG